MSDDQFKGLNDPMEIADNGSMRAVAGDMIENENKNKESNSMKILSDVLDLLTSSLLFYPLGISIGDSEDSSTQSDVHVLPILSPSKAISADGDEKSVTRGKLRPIASEELLHSAAIGIRQLVHTTLKYDFNEQFFLGTDTWPNMSITSLNRPIGLTINCHVICRVMTAIGVIFKSESLTKSKNISSSIETGAARSKTALRDSLHKSQSRGIFSAGIDLLHKCLILNCDKEVLECSRTLLPTILPWLSKCYSDASDPFGVTTVSSDAFNNAAGSVKLPDVSSTSTSDNTSGRQITSGRKVGCLRVQFGQIIALTCRNADQNYISNLYRILGHKLSQLPNSKSSIICDMKDSVIASLNLNQDDQVLIAGVVTALGSITIALTTWNFNFRNLEKENKKKSEGDFEYQSNLVLKEYNSLLNIINIILNLPTKKADVIMPTVTSIGIPPIENNSTTANFTELKVVVLRVLRDLASSGLMSVVSDDTHCTSVALVNIVRSYDQREAVDQGNAARNGRSSSMSMIVAAAIDALSTICVSGVKEGIYIYDDTCLSKYLDYEMNIVIIVTVVQLFIHVLITIYFSLLL